MPRLKAASPQISVHLYKTVTRGTVGGQTSVSARYQGQEDAIDLTPYLNAGSSVRTSKSVREPAGAFSITFADRPQSSILGAIASMSASAIESIYGLVEPMDMIEIRMWHGAGPKPAKLPIIMRGFVSDVRRSQTMGNDGTPHREVIITGQDYGKIWQMYQVIYLAAYAEGKPILTNFGLYELFGVSVVDAMPAADFVREMINKIINPHLAGFVPQNSPMPKSITVGDGVTVAHGKVNNSFHNMQGAIYDIMKFHGDVGIWNELYTEDREDGVHLVYRPVPALHLSPGGSASGRKIQDDAPTPIYCEIPDSDTQSLSVARTDADVANFYWVTNSKFDMVSEMQRKLMSIPADDGRVSTKDYPNSAYKYYATRAKYGETQQGDDAISTMSSGQEEEYHEQREARMEAWIDRRRRHMLEMNRDNVVFERGSARIKGGPMRPGGAVSMRAGDYARFKTGTMDFDAYVVQIEHEFMAFQSYTTTLQFERGEGFAVRSSMGGGASSPWLAEQALR